MKQKPYLNACSMWDHVENRCSNLSSPEVSCISRLSNFTGLVSGNLLAGTAMDVDVGYSFSGRQKNNGPSQCSEHNSKVLGNNLHEDGSARFSIVDTWD